MIRDRIKTLRDRLGCSIETLSNNSGVSADTLRRVEAGEIERIDPSALLNIADSLKIKSGAEYIHFLKSNGVVRRSHLYTVGLVKTGTASIRGLFENYRSTHEFLQWDTHQAVSDYFTGKTDREAFRLFLLSRDIKGGFIECDSAHYNRHYIDILAAEFPSAKFICLIRDCYSWLNSVIAYFTFPKREALIADGYSNGFPFSLPVGDCEEKKELVRNFEKYIDHPLTLWREEYEKILANLPPGRSLIVRTHEITPRLDEIALFAGIPADTLSHENSHLNKGVYKVDILRNLDRGFLESKFNEHCCGLMDRFFPGYSLADYYSGLKIEPHETVLESK